MMSKLINQKVVFALSGMISLSLCGFSAYALPVDPWDIGSLPRLSKFHIRLPVNSECERILISAEKRLNRPMTKAEVIELLPRVLARTGESLKPKRVTGNHYVDLSAFEETDFGYFPGSAKVLTTSGYRMIGELEGQTSEILAFDDANLSFSPGGRAVVSPVNSWGEYAELQVDGMKIRTGISTKLISPKEDFYLLEMETEIRDGLEPHYFVGTRIIMNNQRVETKKGIRIDDLKKVGSDEQAYMIQFVSGRRKILVDSLLVMSDDQHGPITAPSGAPAARPERKKY